MKTSLTTRALASSGPCAGVGEDLVALAGGRIGDRVMVEAGGGDHRAGGAGSGDEDLVVVAEEGVGEGDQGAEVAGPVRVLIKTRIKRYDARRARAIPARRRGGASAGAIAIATPAASISTSTGVPWRPSTNDWWNSSDAA